MAYYLHRPENERDYGVKAIEILLQVMENERERLVVVLAGYRDRMDEFFALNPTAESALCSELARGAARPQFAHARSVRNAVERARLRHANRIHEALREGVTATPRELMRIEARDIA